MGGSCSNSARAQPQQDEGGASGNQQKHAAGGAKKKGAGQAGEGVGHLGADIPLDPVTKHDLAKFDALEATLKGKLCDKAAVNAMWKTLDFNGNNMASLAEIDKWIVDPQNGLEILNHKPALMRAYKLTISVEGKHTQRKTDFIHKKEFGTLIRNVFYYNKIYQVFEEMANSPSERRIDLANFKIGAEKMGLARDDAQAEAEFNEIAGGGREILFDQFCHYVAHTHLSGVSNIDDELAEGATGDLTIQN
jgi:hypothetical protein